MQDMMTLLSPMLVWGALLGVIPIIIHLLNRRRFRRVEWAPMRYLKLTIQRNRRRIQIEQFLLLLLRIGLLVLLFFFLARPVLNPTGLERWLGSGGRSSQVVLVDDSLSMGYTAGEPIGLPARPRDGRRAPGRVPAAGSLHARDDLGPAQPRAPRGRGVAPRRAPGRRAVPAADRRPTPPGRRCWRASTS